MLSLENAYWTSPTCGEVVLEMKVCDRTERARYMRTRNSQVLNLWTEEKYDPHELKSYHAAADVAWTYLAHDRSLPSMRQQD